MSTCPSQKSDHVYVEGDMTNNETLHAFVDCEKLPNGRNVSEVQWRNNMSYRFISSTPKNHGPIKLRLIADDFFSQPLNQLLCPTSNAAFVIKTPPFSEGTMEKIPNVDII